MSKGRGLIVLRRFGATALAAAAQGTLGWHDRPLPSPDLLRFHPRWKGRPEFQLVAALRFGNQLGVIVESDEVHLQMMRRGCRLQCLIGRGYGDQFLSLVVYVTFLLFFGFILNQVSVIVIVTTGSATAEPPVPEGAYCTSASAGPTAAIDVVGIVRNLPVPPLPPVVSHSDVFQGYPNVAVLVHDDGVEIRDLLRRRWAGLNGEGRQ
mmetsp:Transcript_18643/g.53596  ORF Transcript_18643/g.53596 Transcript_18643/m.53596 type:complete len:208 (+) Transcript_18643:2219-2842(+)